VPRTTACFTLLCSVTEPESSTVDEGEAQIQIGRMIPLLQVSLFSFKVVQYRHNVLTQFEQMSHVDLRRAIRLCTLNGDYMQKSHF